MRQPPEWASQYPEAIENRPSRKPADRRALEDQVRAPARKRLRELLRLLDSLCVPITPAELDELTVIAGLFDPDSINAVVNAHNRGVGRPKGSRNRTPAEREAERMRKREQRKAARIGTAKRRGGGSRRIT